MAAEETKCPLCELPLKKMADGDGTARCDCANCGTYELALRAMAMARNELSPEQRRLLSYVVRKQQTAGHPSPRLGLDEIERILASERLPSPREMADNFVLLLGETQGADPGRRGRWEFEELCARLGALSSSAVIYTVMELEKAGVLYHDPPMDSVVAQLTFRGWERYEELKHGAVDSKRAFMAMKYGDPLLDDVYRKCFKPAVRRAGFDLGRLDERAPAGHIDSRMLEVIRRSRFVVADITYDNSGAYWEAGFAEGLDKKVIYTVSKVWIDEDRKNRVHFDTDHFNRIEWDVDNLEEAGGKLTAMIRNTFLAEVKMVDG